MMTSRLRKGYFYYGILIVILIYGLMIIFENTYKNL